MSRHICFYILPITITNNNYGITITINTIPIITNINIAIISLTIFKIISVISPITIPLITSPHQVITIATRNIESPTAPNNPDHQLTNCSLGPFRGGNPMTLISKLPICLNRPNLSCLLCGEAGGEKRKKEREKKVQG